MACLKQRVPPTSNSPRGSFVCNYFDLICIKHGTGHPGDQPFSREWGAESTPLENNTPNMEDTDTWAIRAYKTWYLFEGLEFGTYKFTWNGRYIPYIGRYSGLMWNNFGVYGVWMHKQYSRLVQVKATKRLGSDQLESDNSHEHALKLINTECKHE